MAKKKSKAKRRRASKKRALKKQPQVVKKEDVTNKHHILWQSTKWDEFEPSKQLRLHKYFIKEVPRDTLHKLIHSTIAGIPVPSKKLCKKALNALEYGVAHNLLDIENDSIEKRIQFLLNIWDFDGCPRTYLMLKWQQELVYKFYYNQGV